MIAQPLDIPLLPEPFRDETLGSWLQRCAVAHRQTSAESFAASVLALEGHVLPRRCDLDIDPPRALLEILARRSRFTLVRLRALVVQPGPSVLRPWQRVSYCPMCFDEDLERGAIHMRRAWIDSWTFTCSVHGCPLGWYAAAEHDERERRAKHTPLLPVEQRRLGVTALGQMWCCGQPALWWHADRNASTSNWIRDYEHESWFDPQMLTSQTGRSLLMLAGSELSGNLHWVLYMQDRPRDRWWHDEEGCAVNWPRATHPQGPALVRLSAAHAASVAWRALGGRLPRPQDAKVWLQEIAELVGRWGILESRTYGRVHGFADVRLGPYVRQRPS